MTKETNKDYGLFNGDPYTYTSVRIYKDNDTRLSRKDSWCLKQINEKLSDFVGKYKSYVDSWDVLSKLVSPFK